MLILDSLALGKLRLQQANDAEIDWRCELCSAQLWHNYCRKHEEYFEAGHDPVCEKATHPYCEETY